MLFTNAPWCHDTICRGDCACSRLVFDFTGKKGHFDQCFFGSAHDAAAYVPAFCDDFANCVLEHRFGGGGQESAEVAEAREIAAVIEDLDAENPEFALGSDDEEEPDATDYKDGPWVPSWEKGGRPDPASKRARTCPASEAPRRGAYKDHPAHLIVCRATLALTWQWWSAIYVEEWKKRDFRADIPYYQVRLLEPFVAGELDKIRLRHGYTRPDRVAVYEVLDVQVVPIASIPRAEAPPPGSPLHARLFRTDLGLTTVIQTTFGRRLAGAPV